MSSINLFKVLGACVALGLCLSLASCSSADHETAPAAWDQFKKPFGVKSEHVMFALPYYESATRDQMLLINISRLLETKAVTHNERAQVFYELGIIYDRLGMQTTARAMFMNALSENRRFAPAYNFIGIYFAGDGRFQEALDAFDSALELDPDDAYVNFNRAIVLYLAGRAATALPDFITFYKADRNDPYRMLWLYLCESSITDRDRALSALKLRYLHADEKQKTENWGYNIVRLYLGQTDEDEFFKEIKTHESEVEEFADHLCEGYFYLGMLRLIDGDEHLCYDLMSLAAATHRYAFLEYRYAVRILRDLGRKHNIYNVSGESLRL